MSKRRNVPDGSTSGMDDSSHSIHSILTFSHMPFIWALVAAAISANGAGYVFNLFDRIFWYDKAVHGFTIFVITLVLGVLAVGRVVVFGSGWHYQVSAVLVVASMGLAVGALWEVAEWAFDIWAAGNVILGKQDTIGDLIADTVGAVLGGWLSYHWSRGKI